MGYSAQTIIKENTELLQEVLDFLEVLPQSELDFEHSLRNQTLQVEVAHQIRINEEKCKQ